jgi:hypothetical protein
MPDAFGLHTPCYNRFVHRGRAGAWRHTIDGLATAHNGAVQMIETPHYLDVLAQRMQLNASACNQLPPAGTSWPQDSEGAGVMD